MAFWKSCEKVQVNATMAMFVISRYCYCCYCTIVCLKGEEGGYTFPPSELWYRGKVDADSQGRYILTLSWPIIAAIEKSMDIGMGSTLPPRKTVRLVQKKRSTRQECQEMLSVIGYCVMFFLFGLYFGRFFTLRQHGVGRTSGWVTTPHSVTIGNIISVGS